MRPLHPANSPLISAGIAVDLAAIAPGFDATGNARTTQLSLGVDIFGSEVTTPPTVGPASYRPADGNGLLTGTVTDHAGTAIAGATVSYGAGSATINARGGYAIEVPAGNHTLVPSSTGFEDGTAVELRVRHGQMRHADLTLGGPRTTATPTGT